MLSPINKTFFSAGRRGSVAFPQGGGRDATTAAQTDQTLAYGHLNDGAGQSAFLRQRGGRGEDSVVRVCPADLSLQPLSIAPPFPGPLFLLSLSSLPALVCVGCPTAQVAERAPLGELTLPARGCEGAGALQVQVLGERRWMPAATDLFAAAGSGMLLPPVARTGFASVATSKRIFVFGGLTRSSLLIARERAAAAGGARGGGGGGARAGGAASPGDGGDNGDSVVFLNDVAYLSWGDAAAAGGRCDGGAAKWRSFCHGEKNHSGAWPAPRAYASLFAFDARFSHAFTLGLMGGVSERGELLCDLHLCEMRSLAWSTPVLSGVPLAPRAQASVSWLADEGGGGGGGGGGAPAQQHALIVFGGLSGGGGGRGTSTRCAPQVLVLSEQAPRAGAARGEGGGVAAAGEKRGRSEPRPGGARAPLAVAVTNLFFDRGGPPLFSAPRCYASPLARPVGGSGGGCGAALMASEPPHKAAMGAALLPSSALDAGGFRALLLELLRCALRFPRGGGGGGDAAIGEALRAPGTAVVVFSGGWRSRALAEGGGGVGGGGGSPFSLLPQPGVPPSSARGQPAPGDRARGSWDSSLGLLLLLPAAAAAALGGAAAALAQLPASLPRPARLRRLAASEEGTGTQASGHGGGKAEAATGVEGGAGGGGGGGAVAAALAVTSAAPRPQTRMQTAAAAMGGGAGGGGKRSRGAAAVSPSAGEGGEGDDGQGGGGVGGEGGGEEEEEEEEGGGGGGVRGAVAGGRPGGGFKRAAASPLAPFFEAHAALDTVVRAWGRGGGPPPPSAQRAAALRAAVGALGAALAPSLPAPPSPPPPPPLQAQLPVPVQLPLQAQLDRIESALRGGSGGSGGGGGAPPLLRAELAHALEGLTGAGAALAAGAARLERCAGAAADAQAAALGDVQATLRDLARRGASAAEGKEKELQAAISERAFLSGALARVEAERDRCRIEAEAACKRAARSERELAEASAGCSEARAEAQRLRVERAALIADLQGLERARGALQNELEDVRERLNQAAVAVGAGGGRKKG